MTDLRSLMLESLAGSDPATQKLLTRLSGSLRSYFKERLRRIGRTAVDAEDLVQETLISIHTHRQTYDPRQPFGPWAFAIARYKLVDYLRRTKSSSMAVTLDDRFELPSTEDADAVESRLDLSRLISQLAPKMRRAIDLVKIQGLSVSEAAELTDMSESAVKVSVHRGLKSLVQLARKRKSA